MDYQQKYLKYKSKYNQLKENQNNQIGGLDFGELRAYFLTEDVFKMCIENQVVKQNIDKICKYIEENNTKIEKLKIKNKTSCNVQTTNICTPPAETAAPVAPTAETAAQVAPTADSAPTPLFHSMIPGVAHVRRKLFERNEKIKTEKSDKIKLECDRLNKQNDDLKKQYDTEIKKIYNGENKRFNFHMYGMNLYDKLYGTEKLTFKLQNRAPYCKQNDKFVYFINEEKKLDKQENTNSNAFDYTKPASINSYINHINRQELIPQKYKNLNKYIYMVITRWYRTSPEILICVYTIKKEGDSYKFELIPPGEFYNHK